MSHLNMKYKITITRVTDNLDYEQQMKERKAEFYSRSIVSDNGYPQREIQEEALSMTVEAPEFDAIRKACLEAMK